MSQDYSEKDLHLFVRGELRTDGWKSDWRKEFERRHAEDAAKPRPIVRATQIAKRRIRSKDGISRAFSGAPCMACGRPMRADVAGPVHERCARLRPKCPCGKTLKINWPHSICGTCYRAAERERMLAGKRVCAEAGCGRILQKNNTYPKCRKHADKLRNARNAQRKREAKMAMKEAA